VGGYFHTSLKILGLRGYPQAEKSGWGRPAACPGEPFEGTAGSFFGTW
jgi:hypothetical protein